MAKTANLKKENKAKSEPTTPQLVDKDNNVVYDGDAELKKVMDKVEVKEEDIKVPEVVQEAIDTLKTVEGLNEKINADEKSAKEFAEKEIAKAEDIEKRLEEDIKERTSKLTNEQKERLEKMEKRVRTFWNGFSDGWY